MTIEQIHLRQLSANRKAERIRRGECTRLQTNNRNTLESRLRLMYEQDENAPTILDRLRGCIGRLRRK